MAFNVLIVDDSAVMRAMIKRVVRLSGVPLGDFLEADGWDVRYLGAATPGVEIDRMAREVLPDAVCLSTTLTTHLPNVATVIAALRASPKPPFTLVGGRAYGGDPAVARHVGADAFAADASEAAVVLRQAFSLD